MPPIPEGHSQQSDIVGKQRHAAVYEVQGEEICAAGDKVTAVSGHRAFWTMGFAPLYPILLAGGQWIAQEVWVTR